MNNSAGLPPPGWHPDPHGRHQYRFWDGTQWTERVADNGGEASDPVYPVDAGPVGGGDPTSAGAPSAGQPPTDGPAAGAGADEGGQGGMVPSQPPPPSSGVGRKQWFVIVGAAIIAAVVVLVLVFTLGGGGTKKPALGSGPGKFTAKVGKGEAKARVVDLQAGDLLTVKYNVTRGDARVSFAASRDLGEKLGGPLGLLSESDLSDAYDSARALLSGANDSQATLDGATRRHPYVNVDGFEGIVAGPAGVFLTPARGKVAVIVVGSSESEIHFDVRVRHNGKHSDLNSEQYGSFSSDLSGNVDQYLTDQCRNERDLTAGACKYYGERSNSSDYSYSDDYSYSSDYGLSDSYSYS